MCRSIKTLREPYAEVVTEADIQAAALQYVRKISGFRTPAAHNAAAFDAAVASVASATATLLDQLVVRGSRGGDAQAAASAGTTESGAHRER
nr:DUF2277 family protein [Micromonospora sp. DSM 115978]